MMLQGLNPWKQNDYTTIGGRQELFPRREEQPSPNKKALPERSTYSDFRLSLIPV